ncbi:MAG: hypothetical protein QOK02_2827 [Mycobacterium sp.]|jgi:hypothetical protein|nr:hypothetical protein [Mycobacterium sp.]
MFRPYRPRMAVRQRTQYLYGKTVVEIEDEQRQLGTNGPADVAVERPKATSHTELRQAEYYQDLLEELRTELLMELAHLRASPAARPAEATVSGASRMKRVIEAKETELTEIDRLIAALHARFATLPFHGDDPESLRRIAV